MLNKFTMTVIFFLSSCAVIKDEPFRPISYVELVGNNNLYVIEYDDNGFLHVEDQRNTFLSDIDAGLTEKELVIFIHGWHHNASLDDENYISFKMFLEYLNQGSEKYTGLYIGWRGDQNDPFWIDGSMEAIDFLTLRERKSVSVVVGKNGVKNLLGDLDERILSGSLDRFVLIGHSLGASVVFHASKNRLNLNDKNIYLLLNPALTASEYKPIYLEQSNKPKNPKMVILQSKTDSAINFFFDLVNVGEDAAGNSWAISHDLDSCPHGDNTCTIPRTDDDCVVLINKNTWKITARENNGTKRMTCSETNMLRNWLISVDANAIDKHNGILEINQAETLIEVLMNEDGSLNKKKIIQN